MSNLEHALRAARIGPVFPIVPGTKDQPMLANWPQLATQDEALIRQQWGPNGTPEANVGLHCRGMIVVDVDVKKGGPRSLALLRLTEGLPDTLEARTPSGGQHLFFRLPDGHAGCPNGVDVLGPGLDIRSVGGYVVAAGSEVPAGVYAWRNEGAEAVLAPDWLVQRLGNAAPKAPTAEVPDAPVESVERACQWLKGQSPAIEGQGGDAHTYAVACGLRDMGLSANQAFGALQDGWNQRCSPPWDLDQLWAKVENAYRYSQNEHGGARGVVEDDLPLPSNTQSGGEKPKRRTRLVRADEFAAEAGEGPGYVVKNLLQRASYAIGYGSPGVGKTFVFLDIGYHVANSKPWMGMLVRGGPVLYLAYEGIGGLKKRARALQKKYGDNLGSLYVVGATMNLREQAGRQELGALMGEMPEKPVLIVIDTFARALMGGDENSAQDVGAFNDAVAKLIDATGACVLAVHHSGKNKAAGARGSSAILGAIDTELELEAGAVRPSKQRDVEIVEPIAYKLRPVVVGIDADGDEERSCVVEAGSSVAHANRPLSAKGEHAFSIVCEMTGPQNNPVPRSRVVAKLQDEGFGRSTSHEWVRKLAKFGRVTVEDEMVTRRMA